MGRAQSDTTSLILPFRYGLQGERHIIQHCASVVPMNSLSFHIFCFQLLSENYEMEGKTQKARECDIPELRLSELCAEVEKKITLPVIFCLTALEPWSVTTLKSTPSGPLARTHPTLRQEFTQPPGTSCLAAGRQLCSSVSQKRLKKKEACQSKSEEEEQRVVQRMDIGRNTGN